MKRTLIVCLLLGWLYGCGQSDQPPVEEPGLFETATRLGKVLEIIEVEAYTYILIDEHGREVWLATNPVWVQTGDYVTFRGGVLMRDFASEELNRTFDNILFVDGLEAVDPDEAKEQITKDLLEIGVYNEQAETRRAPGNHAIAVTPVEGGLTVAEIYLLQQGQNQQGETIKLSARVDKVSANILKRNWVTVVDGTGTEPDNKLVITTLETPEVGAVYTIEGQLLFDQYVGPGYTYKVLITDATFQE